MIKIVPFVFLDLRAGLLVQWFSLVMALISASLFLVPKFRLGKQECMY